MSEPHGLGAVLCSRAAAPRPTSQHSLSPCCAEGRLQVVLRNGWEGQSNAALLAWRRSKHLISCSEKVALLSGGRNGVSAKADQIDVANQFYGNPFI